MLTHRFRSRKRIRPCHSSSAAAIVTLSSKIPVMLLYGAAIWCAAILLAPVCVAGAGFPKVIGQAIYFSFGEICHQIDSRSVYLGDYPLAVCVRCSAVYFGFLLGTIMYVALGSKPSTRYSYRWLVIIASVPMLFDVAGGTLGVYSMTDFSRLFTGGWFGIIIAWCVIPLAVDGAGQMARLHRFQIPSRLRGFSRV